MSGNEQGMNGYAHQMDGFEQSDWSPPVRRSRSGIGADERGMTRNEHLFPRNFTSPHPAHPCEPYAEV